MALVLLFGMDIMVLCRGRATRPPQFNSRAGFTILEVAMAAGVLAIALGSIFALNSQVTSHVRRGVSGSYASQLIQERMEQFRRAAWTELTSNYPPVSDDAADSGYDSDLDAGETAYVDDSYATDFPYDLSDLDDTAPGLQELMAVATASAAQLPNVTETIKVETYNPSSDILPAYTGALDTNGNPVTVDVAPYTCGGTPITVHRQNGTVTVDSFNPLLVLSTTIRLTITVAWQGTDNVTRTKETVTLFTVEGDK
jgi:hypothetical protein